MATIAENLKTIKDSTEAIKSAILEKGGTIEGNLTTYASAIANLPSGGGDVNQTATKNDVTFYDYDGTIRYSYTAEEFLALTEMPPLPTQEGLICQEWNWAFEDAREYVAEYGILDVGATYIKGKGAYSGTDKDIIMAVMRKVLAPKAEEVVKDVDPTAFMIFTSATEIYGQGYKNIFSEKL
jgi:hypothetical protein